MGVLNVIRGRDNAITAQASAEEGSKPPSPSLAGSIGNSSPDSSSLEAQKEEKIQAHPDEIAQNAPPGTQKAEASVIVWGKPALYTTYAWIWVCFFMLALQSAIGNNVINNAYSSFSAAPQISMANILASIIGGVLKLPIAKILNVWGRAEGFLIFVGIYVIGIIVIASCNGPNTYAIGYVFYWVGYDAIYLILDVFVADTTGLRNRAFAFAFVSTPFICTAFTGPLAATALLNTGGWRWAYGAFAIIMPCVFLPLAAVFKFHQRKAERLGILVPSSNGRSAFESLVHYLHEFDVIGCLLLMAAFIIILLPFSLNTYGMITYSSASFIVMVVVGVLLFPVFGIWEKYGARVHFIRWELFSQPTILGACGLAAMCYFSFYSWDMYYYNFVTVVYDLDTTQAGYMTQIYNIGTCFWGVVFGVYIRYTRHFKWACMLFGLPVLMLGAGLMIHFRGQAGSIGYTIMCQIFVAIGGGTLIIGEDMAVMAAADRDGVPMMLALISLASSLGGAIGTAVSAAIFANTFPTALRSALPEAEKANYLAIYNGGYTMQLKYPVGGSTREAIDHAWGYSQKTGCISATAILILAIPCIFVWKNYRVDEDYNKGTVR